MEPIVNISKYSKSRNFVVTFILLLMFIFIVWIVYQKLNKPKQVKEGFKNELNQVFGELRNVGREIGQMPGKIQNDGNDVKNISNTVGKNVTKVVDDTKKVSKDIENKVNSAVKKIEEEGNRITNLIDEKFMWFIKEVEKAVKDIVNNKILGFFNELGRALERGLVDPVVVLFTAIGQVFVLLGDIIMMIINKIISLPDCVPHYGWGAGSQMAKKFMPGWLNSIVDFFTSLGQWIANLFKPLLILIGIDVDGWRKAIKEKCYDFPAKRKTEEMENVMKKAGDNFIKNFGRIQMKFNY